MRKSKKRGGSEKMQNEDAIKFQYESGERRVAVLKPGDIVIEEKLLYIDPPIDINLNASWHRAHSPPNCQLKLGAICYYLLYSCILVFFLGFVLSSFSFLSFFLF